MKQKNIAIIGAGIVGSTAAFKLAKAGINVTVFDEGTGQATAGAAGIICPWLSQRRNKEWYHLTSTGASYYPQLMAELEKENIAEIPYKQVGTYVFKHKEQQLEKLLKIAQKRREDAPMIGDLKIVTKEEIQEKIPGWQGQDGAVFCSGGGRVDGKLLTEELLTLAKKYGATIIRKKVSLTLYKERIFVVNDGEMQEFDQIILATGAWLKEILSPLPLSVDVRPQKGQLIEIQMDTTKYYTDNWPVCMLHGEIDFLPFHNGRIIVGATHENDKGFDLTPDKELQNHMYEEVIKLYPGLKNYPIDRDRIGTRAYTSDFAPFFGQLADYPQLLVASGLGSSGLTSGAYIGELLSQVAQGTTPDFPCENYNPANYIHKK
ncbi:Glycine/D-amino acid oxidase [Granulicatella balaenopterae]|uniref:Glycine/D-amino acid oxidase n=1 Tax=Granulicatella balaenopterae TaxID=137733 RepID=A0A1H9JDQ4_9LACT|nr:FAD-dependent oxidoreductase [Granulicatella balaenopterae]SEQ84970.1 Glycine/D-amino acid oxidase [Granulicatella balaenopterae]